ncbi:putative ribonuclease H-like domain-containing protein [Tanacetum coccineum]
MEPKKVIQALADSSWVEAMQEELLQFRLKKVWRLVDLPKGKHAIGTKWVYRNKKDERGIVVRNKARLVTQAYASFMRFIVYQMDVKSAFLYGTIEEGVYVCQPPGFEDPHFPNKVYKVDKALYGLHQALRAWYETLSTYLIENGFRRGIIDKTLFIKKDKGELTFFLGLQVKQKDNGIFISQDKYVSDILKKFDFSSVKTVSTLLETNKALIKDEEAEDVDVHLYRSIIGSLMYLTTFRPDIMFAVCACTRDSPFDLEAFLDSDYAGASLDRKSTTGGCQFLGKRLISWQCKKQTIVANSTTEAEYVAAANCCGQGDNVERAITTDASLVAAQDSDNILKTQSTVMSNDPLSWEIGLDGAEIQGRPSVDTEILLDQEEPTELVEDLGSGEKGEKEISTASATHEVSTVAENLVYLRRSAKKRIDKGKATMKEDEYVQKKAKKQLEQERLRHEEAIRLQEQINEEER